MDETIEAMEHDPRSKLLAIAAVRTNASPREALGIPSSWPDTPALASFLLNVTNPKFEPDAVGDADERARKIDERFQREAAWEAALHGEYRGPRGQFRPRVRVLSPPRPPGD